MTSCFPASVSETSVQSLPDSSPSGSHRAERETGVWQHETVSIATGDRVCCHTVTGGCLSFHLVLGGFVLLFLFYFTV